jgi:hypothetical protein
VKKYTSLLIAWLAATACTNGRPPVVKQASTSSAGVVGVVAHPKATYRISSVDFAAPPASSSSSSSGSGGSSGTPVTVAVTVRLDTTAPFTGFTNFCSLDGSTGVACVCYFKWSEANANAANSVNIPRYVETPISLVQSALAQCNSPDNYPTEVLDGTTIVVGIKPATGLSEFLMPSFNYVKNPASATGDFNDANGHSFDNILHYSCYEQFNKGLSIKSRSTQITVTAAGGGNLPPIPANFANDFCVVNVESGGTVPGGCGTPDVSFSAESNYYNLYTRASDRGAINANSNGGRYTCPLVEQPLAGTTQTTFWPLDATFALATSPSADFPVAVDGFTKVAYGNDPTSQATTCYPSSSSGGSGSGSGTDTILTGCLGFASKPHANGTCGTFKNSAGQNQPLYRLRRFVGVYPPAFEADGRPYNQGQPTDVIYVLDRPVANPNGDPLSPFTMLGPKPCPFSYFDHRTAARTTMTYVATTNPVWTGKNFDGIQLPNTDSANSCSAMVAMPNANNTLISFATVNVNNPINTTNPATNPITALNQVWIRPTHAWGPHYEEDSSFQACAPQSSPVKDPPLHFAKGTDGNVAWCSEVYPTQNGNVDRLDLLSGTPGSIVPFTSHTVKASSSAACVGRVPAGLSGGYTGPARHNDGQTRTNVGEDGSDNVTCDRTIPISSDAFYRMPLLSPPTDTEVAIKADTSFECTVTYDSGGTKRGKATPTGGCCGTSVLMTTGVGGNTAAHLEPTGDGSTPTACLIPNY